MGYQEVIVEQRGRVGIVTLNAPQRLNALGQPMDSEMREAIEAFNDDTGVGAIIPTGAGRGFCAGADIRGWARGIEQQEEGGRRVRISGREENWVAFVQRSKPIIC